MSFRKIDRIPAEEKEVEEVPIEVTKEDIKDEAVKQVDNSIINENLFKLIEDIVVKTVNKTLGKQRNIVNERNLKVIETKVKNTQKVKENKKPVNWIYLK